MVRITNGLQVSASQTLGQEKPVILNPYMTETPKAGSIFIGSFMAFEEERVLSNRLFALSYGKAVNQRDSEHF